MNPADPFAAFNLSGRTALVTGARRGIGRAIALGLAAAGARVILHHAGTEQEAGDAAEVAALCPPGQTIIAAADFSDPEATERFAADLVAQPGGVDIVVLNASIEILQDFPTIDAAAFDRQIMVNLRAPLILLQHLVPAMRARRWGRVLSIGSTQQIRPHPKMLVYAGTKAAQYNWIRNLARESAADGVTVNNLSPGAIATERNVDQFADPAVRTAFEARVPARRLGRPDDLVGAALLLCSDAGQYINAVDLAVDGGLSVP